MKSIGIITIHKINNYGSVLQAYALQKVCEDFGFKVEIIDYDFPNKFHVLKKYATRGDTQSNEPRWIKLLFALALIRQHRGIYRFVKTQLHLSACHYSSPEALVSAPPLYDVYVTGSDQVWNPRYCNGDPTFMLHFAPEHALKISYAASIGTNKLPDRLHPLYQKLLSRYAHISVREESGIEIVKNITGIDATVVLDPTLLLSCNDWNNLAVKRRLYRKKYILCYFLNYTFNAFPYVDQLADFLQKQTGYDLVRVARPPHRLSVCHTHYNVGASPEEFLALVRDAEIVLTTSFHGTAFAVNYGKPVFTIVQNKDNGDSRQSNLMRILGLNRQILPVGSPFPEPSQASYDYRKEQDCLTLLRQVSIDYLEKSLKDE